MGRFVTNDYETKEIQRRDNGELSFTISVLGYAHILVCQDIFLERVVLVT